MKACTTLPPSSSNLKYQGTRVGECDKVYTVWRLSQCATLGSLRAACYCQIPLKTSRKLYCALSWYKNGTRALQT